MTRLMSWVRLPSKWIEERGLCEYRWANGQGADNLAALMALTAISHMVDNETGEGRLSYDQLCEATSLSRAKLAAGLNVLKERGRIETNVRGRGTYKLMNYDISAGWAQFPAAGLYRNGRIQAFEDLHLRNPAELEALKLYFLFASRRDRSRNLTLLTYPKIEEYSGVTRNNIKRALTVLAVQGLVHVDRIPSTSHDEGSANAYRLTHLDTRRHMGTTGRTDEQRDELNTMRFTEIDLAS